MIPQTDPRADYLEHRAAIDSAVDRVLERGHYILGPECESFEREFADYLGVRSTVGVANGTDALTLALMACGIGEGDSVVTVSHTAVATVAAIERCGATPILIDIDPERYTLDPARLEDVLRQGTGRPVERIRAVIVVHLYGCPADLLGILAVAERYGLTVIEDCAQAHGAALDGRRVGTWGQAAAFSFYPTKNLGAIGDGGALATNDPAVAARARSLREYGWRQRYVSAVPGLNSRLDELQAAILRAKLPHLERSNERRRAIASRYSCALGSLPAKLPFEPQGSRHVYHQYVVQTQRRDDLMGWLAERQIRSLIHYPVPVHLQPAYRGRIAQGTTLAATEEVASRVLSLPIYPQLPKASLELVIAAAKDWPG